MPNWCCTQVCFKGKHEDIQRLANDIHEATEFYHKTSLYTNLRYFLYLNQFDSTSYLESFPERNLKNLLSDNYPPSFRGYIIDQNLKIENHGDYSLYHAYFEMAWNMDYHILSLISKLYNVEFSAYSEEPGMDIHHKCKNGSIDTYDYDFTITPDYEQLDDEMERDPNFDAVYDIPVMKDNYREDPDVQELVKRGISYEIKDIEIIPAPVIFGIYYKYIFGVIYDDDIHNKFCKYPEIDPFNRW